jgi:hypothetical protein
MLNDLHRRVVEALKIADAAGATDVGISLDGARLKLEEALGRNAKRPVASLAHIQGPDSLH